MKNKLFFFLLCSVSIMFSQQIKLDDELSITKLSKTEFIVTHYFPWNSNSLIIKASEQDVVLIDTPYNYSATKKMLNWIKQNLTPEKITAINTGFHIDNLGGNSCLIDKGIDIYGSDFTSKLVEERGMSSHNLMLKWLKAPKYNKYRDAYKNPDLKKPTKIFNINAGLILQIGNLTFEVFYPGESHSPDNLVVYIKEKKMLFGGCMVKSLKSNNLGNIADANLIEWPKSIRKVKEKYQNAKLVIPHHGKWGDLKLLDHTLSLFN